MIDEMWLQTILEDRQNRKYDFNFDNRENKYTTTSSSYLGLEEKILPPEIDITRSYHFRPEADNGLTSEEELSKEFWVI